MQASDSTGAPNPGELYVRAMEQTRGRVEAVRPEQWHLPSPNTEWDVRDVLNHLVSEYLWAGELFAGRRIAEVGDRFDGDVLGDDPAGAYRRAMEVARRAVEQPGAMERTVHLSFGDFPGAEYAKQLFVEALIHGWDIAQGSNQDTRLDPALVEAGLPIARELTEMAKGSGVYGEELAVGPEAGPQARLLALLGRRA